MASIFCHPAANHPCQVTDNDSIWRTTHTLHNLARPMTEMIRVFEKLTTMHDLKASSNLAVVFT